MDFLAKHIVNITILDIGARVVESDPLTYANLIENYNVHLTAIEADASACKNIRKSDQTTVINVALGDGNPF